MGRAKWIVGLLGWVAWGPIGALLGFFAGAVWDGAVDVALRLGGADAQPDGPRPRANDGFSASEQRNSFFVSLLVLSWSVIRADGKTHPAEVETVKDFVRTNFGEAAVADAVRIMDRLSTQEVNLYEVGPQVARYMNYSQRLQLFHYLVRIAIADGHFDAKEKSVLEAIGGVIGLSAPDVSSVIAMFYKDSSSAYAVLEIAPSATDDEVRAAYRRMAMKHHPDKVATLGPEVQKAAAEKFRKIHEAYETIKKERGIA